MKKFTIYGREDCGFCIKAIHLCLHKGFSFDFINMIDKNISKEQLSQQLSQPVATVPQILLDDKYIGGSDDLENYLNDNKCSSFI